MGERQRENEGERVVASRKTSNGGGGHSTPSPELREREWPSACRWEGRETSERERERSSLSFSLFFLVGSTYKCVCV